MWTFAVSPLELVFRSVVVYALFLAALRLAGKRELGQFTIFDLALVLLASNALQPAITGSDVSLGGALVIVATLFALNRLVAFGRSRSRWVRRLLDDPAAVLARNGKWSQQAIEHEGLSEEDLEAAIREHGLATIGEVKLAVLEPDGSISVVPRDGRRVSIRQRHRRYRARGSGTT